MKSNYSVKRVNSPFDDNGVFVRNVYMKNAVLFDCGKLGNMSVSDLSDISSVFVTHTHIDHFCGFDRFLRSCLLSDTTIKFFGPSGFIDNIKGKIAGYNWNLIRDYNVSFLVTELSEYGGRKSSLFSAKNGFQEEQIAACGGDILLDDGFSLEYDFFYHGISSIGYRLKEPARISINKDKMREIGVREGKWIKIFKEELLKGADDNAEIEVDISGGVKKFPIKELAEIIAEYPPAQDITYITDIAPTLHNCEKAVRLADKSHILFIESVFMKNDINHAINKNHLTTELAKLIFRKSGSDYVSFGHFAPRYDRMRDVFFDELYKDMDMKRVIKNKLVR